MTTTTRSWYSRQRTIGSRSSRRNNDLFASYRQQLTFSQWQIWMKEVFWKPRVERSQVIPQFPNCVEIVEQLSFYRIDCRRRNIDRAIRVLIVLSEPMEWSEVLI
jgi:hypothetical protein